MTESIEIWRLKAGYKTPTALAAKIGVSAETVRRWERGINQPSELAKAALRNLGWSGKTVENGGSNG